MRSLIAPIAMPLLRFATRSYITGPNVSDAIDVANAAARQGHPATLCYWNETLEDGRQVADRYLSTLDAIDAAKLDGYLAVKIPALWDRQDLVQEVVARARQTGRRIVFNSHAPEASDTTLAMLEQLGPEGLGCAIPGRWQRSLADCDRAMEIGASIRVVKGQWPDPACPDIDLAEGFLAVVDRLAGRASHVGIATHDGKLAGEALRRLKSAGTSCELELLYGLPLSPAMAAARDVGVGVRIYVPFGTAWLPYSASRALQNPRILMWILRDLVKGRDRTLSVTRRT